VKAVADLRSAMVKFELVDGLSLSAQSATGIRGRTV
jgi:hypothetical protein